MKAVEKIEWNILHKLYALAVYTVLVLAAGGHDFGPVPPLGIW